MAESESGRGKTEAGVHDLLAAIDRVRNSQAERDDVVVEMRYAARARLEILAQDLRPVFDDIPPGHDQFEFALTTGDTPRLWIDMTSFVRVGRDRRTYEFVKDTRLGRVVLAETDRRDRVARKVTDYVAERILERERALEGDWVAMKAPQSLRQERRGSRPFSAGERWPAWAIMTVFAMGLAAGAAGMILWQQYSQTPF